MDEFRTNKRNGVTTFQGNQYSSDDLELPQNAKTPTQEDLAAQLGISVDALESRKNCITLTKHEQKENNFTFANLDTKKIQVL